MTDMHRADANPDAAPETVEPAAAEPAPPEREDPALALAREASELKDKLLRTLAEMENLRARTAREVADSRTYAVASFARDVLTVADNMARALQTLRAGLNEKPDGSVKALLDGVELTERELLKVLEKHGVRKFEPQPGEKFDPNLHQAMYEVADPSLPGGTVAQVVQAGYTISERILRPALVAVAKGAPKPPSEPSANDNAEVESGSAK
jgi:molecular chaperone GrpE